MIRVLAHTEYVGDLKSSAFFVAESLPQVMRARVFRPPHSQDDNAVIVLYTGNMQPTELAALTTLSATLEVIKAESVTGELLPIEPLVITNGLIYIYAKVPEGLIDTDTAAMVMLDGAKKPHVKFAGGPLSQLVPVFDDSKFESNSAGYKVKFDAFGTSSQLRLPLTIYNVATADIWDNNMAVDNPTVFIDPDMTYSSMFYMARNPLEHHIMFNKEVELLDEFRIQYRFVNNQPITANMAPPYSVLSLRFLNEPTWEGLLEKHKNNVPLDISAEKWTPSASGSLSIDATESGGVTLKCTFGDVDKWCYPRLAVPEGIDLTQYSGVILRARAWGDTTPRFFLHEGDTGAGYMSESPLFPADGEWHAVRIPFDRLIYCAATPPDPNGRLDLETVNVMSVGYNTQSREASLEIGDCVLIGP